MPALSHSQSVSWVRVAGSMDLAGRQREGEEDETGVRGWRGLECYSKGPRCFSTSHGKVLMMGWGRGLNALG